MTTAATAAPTAVDTTSLTGSQVVLQALVEQGVEVIFGYPGGAVLPIYDAIFQQDRIRHILVRHEQAAMHAAEGYARRPAGSAACWATNTGLTDALTKCRSSASPARCRPT